MKLKHLMLFCAVAVNLLASSSDAIPFEGLIALMLPNGKSQRAINRLHRRNSGSLPWCCNTGAITPKKLYFKRESLLY